MQAGGLDSLIDIDTMNLKYGFGLKNVKIEDTVDFKENVQKLGPLVGVKERIVK